MKKGIVRISPQLFKDALDFPADWEIESMSFKNCDDSIIAVISGSDFPETTGVEGANIKECIILVHEKKRTFEVKEVA